MIDVGQAAFAGELAAEGVVGSDLDGNDPGGTFVVSGLPNLGKSALPDHLLKDVIPYTVAGLERFA
jgi:hypothetical protein